VSEASLLARLRARGVALSALGGRMRACTHLDVTRAMIDEAAALIGEALAAGPDKRA
jgi:threonine aldolase